MKKISLMTLLLLSVLAFSHNAVPLSEHENKIIVDFVEETTNPPEFRSYRGVDGYLELFSGKGHLLDLLEKISSDRGNDDVEKAKDFNLSITELPKDANPQEVNLYKKIRELIDASKAHTAKALQKLQPILLSILKNAAQEPGFDVSHTSLQTVIERPEVKQAIQEASEEYRDEGNELVTRLQNIKRELSSPESFETVVKEKEIVG